MSIGLGDIGDLGKISVSGGGAVAERTLCRLLLTSGWTENPEAMKARALRDTGSPEVCH